MSATASIAETTDTGAIIHVDSRQYEDDDDCLGACADEIRDTCDLAGWDLDEDWADDDRSAIRVAIPAHAVAEVLSYFDGGAS